MRKLFWPLLALTAVVGARHFVMTAYWTNRSVWVDLNRASRQTDPAEQAIYLEKVIHTLDSYSNQVRFFRLIDRYPKTHTLNRMRTAVANMHRDAKYGSNPDRTVRAISQEINTHRGLSVAVIDSQQRQISTILFWAFAILTGVAGMLKTMAPPE